MPTTDAAVSCKAQPSPTNRLPASPGNLITLSENHGQMAPHQGATSGESQLATDTWWLVCGVMCRQDLLSGC